MKTIAIFRRAGGILRSCLLLSLAACAAHASVLYTFTATTRASLGSPSHQEMFELQLPAYLPVTDGGPVISFFKNDPAVTTCIACQDSVPAIHFLRSSSSDLIQFADTDGTTRLYMFPVNALSNLGSVTTLPGINVNVGALVVSSVPEPSTATLLLISAAAIAWRWRARRGSLVGTGERHPARPSNVTE